VSYRYGGYGRSRDWKSRDILKPLAIGAAVLLVILLISFLIASPLFHPFAIAIWKHWPGLVVLGIALGGVLLTLYERALIGVPIAIIFVLWAVIGSVLGDAWKKEVFLANTNIEQLQTEPETTGFRFLPLEVAQTTATNKTTDSQVTPTNPEPIVSGNSATWIVPEEPNNTQMKYFGQQPGYLTVNTTADTERYTTGYTPGFGLCCFSGRSVPWTSIRKHFWADYQEEYMTNLSGETVIVKPYLTYYLSFAHVLPVMVPEYGGVLIFHADGTSEDLTPSEAAQEYPEGRFYPHELAKYFSQSYQYKNGIINALFVHNDMPDVPKLGAKDDKSANEFPFLLPVEGRSVWYTAAEPYGASKSVKISYYIDATTGAVQVYDYGNSAAYVGPDRAESYVNNAFNTLKGTSFYEPRPLVKNGNLYWMLSASASGTPDVQFTALVDAHSEDVIRLNNQQEVERVVNGEDPRKVGQVVSGSGASTDTTQSTTSTTSGGSSDVSSMSNEQLAKELREAADRLEKAGK
jgi:hypothetical protein